jgi:hypothetical protein
VPEERARHAVVAFDAFVGASAPLQAPALSRRLGLLFGLGLLLLVAAVVVVLVFLVKTRAAQRRRVEETSGPLLLPGRFLVEEDENDVEVRLIRTGQGEREETTIGRDPGPPFRHLQLRVASVSVRHAKLVCEDGGYSIVNYSRTNPTRVNGEELPENASRRLVDGDRIECGEVSMTYVES